MARILKLQRLAFDTSALSILGNSCSSSTSHCCNDAAEVGV